MSEVKDAAQSFEGSLMILRKDKNGWVFGFSVHPSEAPTALLDAPLGTRFQCVLFQIGDNEEFVPTPEVIEGKHATAKAGELCRNQLFRRFLASRAQNYPASIYDVFGDAEAIGSDPTILSEETAVRVLKYIVGIDSRADLKEDKEARLEFNRIVSEYMDWKEEGNE